MRSFPMNAYDDGFAGLFSRHRALNRNLFCDQQLCRTSVFRKNAEMSDKKCVLGEGEGGRER